MVYYKRKKPGGTNGFMELYGPNSTRKKTGMREINVYIVFKSITTENGTDIYSSSSAADFFDLN
jgi:hypothetical protein